MMFEMDLVASAGVEARTKAARTDTGLTLKTKLSSILDESSDREVERWSRVEMNVLRRMKAEEVTDDQIVCMLISVCGNRLASVRPKASSSPRTSWTTLAHGDAKRSWDLTCFATWEAWRVFRTAA